MRNIAGLHTNVKIYSRLRMGEHRGMMDKTLFNRTAVLKGGRVREMNRARQGFYRGGPIGGFHHVTQRLLHQGVIINFDDQYFNP